MAIYRLGDLVPSIDPQAFVHPQAVIIGNVTIGPESTVWPTTVLRGDFGAIEVGARTSVQDGAVVHATEYWPTIVGSDCVIGHLAHLEGCTIEDGALVGSGAIVLHQAIVESGSVVAAGALVPGRTRIPAGAMAMGVPVTIREGAAAARPEIAQGAAAVYIKNGRLYREQLELIG